MSVLLMLLVALVWFSDLFIQHTVRIDSEDKFLMSEVNGFFSENLLLANVVSLLFTALNAILIGQLNNKYTIIRTRSFLPVLFFVLLMASWHETHIIVHSHLALTLVLLSFFVIFGVYRNRLATEQAFLSSFLIALASVFIEPILLFIPLIWVGLLLFHSMSFRNFLATVLGLLTPWILYLSIRLYFQPDLDWIFHIRDSFEIGITVLDRPMNELIYMAVLFVVSIVGLVGVSSNLNQDSMQTRSLVVFITWLLVLSIVISVLFVRQFFVFLPFIGFGLSVLLAHPLTLKRANFYAVIFIVFIAINIIFVLSNLILKPL